MTNDRDPGLQALFDAAPVATANHAFVEQVMADLREHDCNMLTLGQYLQPSREHLPVDRFVTPEEFEELRVLGEQMGFSNVASGPMVRSSYHADLQANPLLGS